MKRKQWKLLMFLSIQQARHPPENKRRHPASPPRHPASAGVTGRHSRAGARSRAPVRAAAVPAQQWRELAARCHALARAGFPQS